MDLQKKNKELNSEASNSLQQLKHAINNLISLKSFMDEQITIPAKVELRFHDFFEKQHRALKCLQDIPLKETEVTVMKQSELQDTVIDASNKTQPDSHRKDQTL